MNFKIKRFVYILNDITNALLKKEKDNLREENKKLKTIVIILSIALLIFIVINIYFLIK